MPSKKKIPTKRATRPAKRRPKKTYVACDVLSQELVDPSKSPWLHKIYKEILKQWSHARIGTIYSYFDASGVLHMHFAERDAYLERKGALRQVPKGHLPPYFMFTAASMVDSKALEVAELLSSVGNKVDPNDPRWEEVATILKKMKMRPNG